MGILLSSIEGRTFSIFLLFFPFFFFFECSLCSPTRTFLPNFDAFLSDRSYTLDAQMGYAHVSGKIAPDVLLKKLAKVGKHIRPDRIDYGFDRYWDNLPTQYASQEHASKEELDAAEPTEAKPTQAPLPAAKIDHKPKKPICCSVM